MTIDKLTSAILEGDIETVRQIIKNEPSLNKQKTRNNQFLIELTKDKGVKRIEAILLLSSEDNKQFYQKQELVNFIGQLISELSESIYCAGWFDGIERELWNLSEDTDIMSINNEMYTINKNEVYELRSLADKLGYWVIWDDNYKPDCKRPIKIDDWKRLVIE